MNVKADARGRWRYILPAIGIGAEFLTGKHGPCPMCEGKDRWRFDDKAGDGTFFCSNCGAGDGIKLVMLRLNLGFKPARDRIAQLIGTAPPPEQRKPVRTDAAKRETMIRLWESGVAVTLDNPAGRYLAQRAGLRVFPKCLRFVSKAIYKQNGEPSTWCPTLLARVDDVEGQPCNIHRTFLSPEGTKAPVADAKRMMEGSMPPGAAVRLTRPVDGVLGVAEGIETAISAMMLFKVPVWAALTAGGVDRWTPPAGVSKVMVFGDTDDSFEGQWAAYSLARRLKRKKYGLDAVEVHLPDLSGTDWNDVHVRLSWAA